MEFYIKHDFLTKTLAFYQLMMINVQGSAIYDQNIENKRWLIYFIFVLSLMLLDYFVSLSI